MDDSLSLTKTGNFYGVENLEELHFGGCKNLKELHSSIGCLHKLAILNLSRCIALKSIPWEMIVKLTSLRELKLSNRQNTLPTPNLRGNMMNPQELKSVTELHLHEVPKFSSGDPQFFMKLTGLTSLTHLSLSGCNVSHVPSAIGNLMTLEELDLSENTFSSLPDSFSNLSQLVGLNIADCSELRSLPLLPSNLTSIIASRCWSLDVMPFDPMQRSYVFHTKVCKVYNPSL